MYAIDLFCGAGGFSEGILQAGFHIVFSSDRSKDVQLTYENRHRQLGLIQGENTFFKCSDIRDLSGEEILESINSLRCFREENRVFQPEDIDVIFGGPPCQGFSVAGRRDKNDPRNMLFREYLRVIQFIRPKYIVMENVVGFLSMQINPDFESFNDIEYRENELIQEVVTQELEAFGYKVLPPQILNAADFGVPQNRQRAIFLAYRNDVTPILPIKPLLQENERLTVHDALCGISINAESEYAEQSSNGRTPHFVTGLPIRRYNMPHLNTERSAHSPVITQRFSLFEEGESVAVLKRRLTRKFLEGEQVIDFGVLPDLLTYTHHELNKEENNRVLNDILNSHGIRLQPTQIKSLLKKILFCTELDNVPIDMYSNIINTLANSYEEINSVEMADAIFRQALLRLNQYIYVEEIIHWFNNVNIQILTNDQGEPSILSEGKNIPIKVLLDAVFTNKNTRTRLKSQSPGPTMVTLPDDFIHPFENIILNVREMARIQSFDDSFEFLGKRTTGGPRRKEEVPQFTQVGNAVPPLLAKAIATHIRRALEA